MADDRRDMLIFFKEKMGKPMCPGECRALIGKDDPLMDGFMPGFFSDAAEFNISVDVKKASAGGKAADPSAKGADAHKDLDPRSPPSGWTYDKNAKGFITPHGFVPFSKGKDSGSGDEYKDFLRDGIEGVTKFNGKAPAFKADLQKLHITKPFDISSLTLLQYCMQRTTLSSVALVKRRPVGFKKGNATRAYGETELQGWLRYDFTDVLITEVSWSEDEVIKETVEFICRKALVNYNPQSDEGRHDNSLDYGYWSFLPEDA